MQRIRFSTHPDGRGAVQVEDLPSGRIQFRSAEAAEAAAAPARSDALGRDRFTAPQAPRFDGGVDAYVEEAIRAATRPGEAAGALDFDALEAEFEQSGRLSEESYALLAAAGIPRRIVQAYIEGQQAQGEKLQAEAEEIAGGPERLRAAKAWAAQNLSDEQLAAYDEAVHASPDRARFAVEGLCAAHRRATGEPPQLTRGESVPTSDGIFHSAQEVSEAIRDPRYKKDPAYRAKVAARLAKSRIF